MKYGDFHIPVKTSTEITLTDCMVSAMSLHPYLCIQFSEEHDAPHLVRVMWNDSSRKGNSRLHWVRETPGQVMTLPIAETEFIENCLSLVFRCRVWNEQDMYRAAHDIARRCRREAGNILLISADDYEKISKLEWMKKYTVVVCPMLLAHTAILLFKSQRSQEEGPAVFWQFPDGRGSLLDGRRSSAYNMTHWSDYIQVLDISGLIG